jgi:hypothetical protein
VQRSLINGCVRGVKILKPVVVVVFTGRFSDPWG